MPRAEQFVLPAKDLTLVSSTAPASDIDLPANTRGLLVGVAGDLNVTINGNELDGVPFQAGVFPGAFTRVRTGGTAQNIWAIT